MVHMRAPTVITVGVFLVPFLPSQPLQVNMQICFYNLGFYGKIKKLNIGFWQLSSELAQHPKNTAQLTVFVLLLWEVSPFLAEAYLS